MKPHYALLSVYDKTGIEDFAKSLISLGFTILSSGGTAKYLIEKGVSVTPVAEITGYKDVLGHRVVTLAPQIHGGLLATPAMRPELEELDWPLIALVYVTFYPLKEELEREGATFESCIEKTDIGGPAMIRSANKGDRIAMVSPDQEQDVLRHLTDGTMDEKMRRVLAWKAETAVAEYVALSAKVYERFQL